MENFYNEGFKVADIDAVLITHAHNDHTVDLESILSLLYKLSADQWEADDTPENERRPLKQIDLLVNAGTFMKYSGWLSLRHYEKSNFVRSIRVLHAGQSFHYEGLLLHITRAKHHEIISSQYSTGCVIEAKGKDGFRIGFTGDTGWEHDGSIGEQYADRKPDLMVAHIGSIKEKEFGFRKAATQEQRQGCYYGNHLGILGISSVINAAKPRLAIVSEFGKEPRDARVPIGEALSEVLGVKSLPGDIGLHIRLRDLAILCVVEHDFVPFETVKAGKHPRKPTDLIYWREGATADQVDYAAAGREFWRRWTMPDKLKKL